MMAPIETWICNLLAQFDLKIRCVVVGDRGVGKSTLIRSYVEQKCLNGPKCIPPKIIKPDHFEEDHVSFLLTLRDDIIAQVALWDTKLPLLVPSSGARCPIQELISQSYFRHTSGVIICYDITRVDTFQHAMHYYREARRHFLLLSGAIFLVGCKADLESKRQVPKWVGAQTAQDYGMHFFETSALKGENISIITALPKEVFSRLEQHDLWLDSEYEGVRLETTFKRLASCPRLEAIWRKSIDNQRRELLMKKGVNCEKEEHLDALPNCKTKEMFTCRARRQRHLSGTIATISARWMSPFSQLKFESS